MSIADEVDGSGWISDDSDFYGNETIKARMESLLAPISMKYNMSLGANRPMRDLAAPPFTSSISSTSLALPVKKSQADIADFLKSRPQIASMQKARSTAAKTATSDQPRTLAGHAISDLVDVNMSHQDRATRQASETVLEFLSRAPVVDESTANLGPWLWVHSPRLPRHQVQRQQKTDTASFRDGGEQLLSAFKDQQSKIEKVNSNKAAGTITRYLRPYREQLEDDLLQLAVKTHTTCGKWMLFPTIDDAARVWRVVAEAAAAGKLGPTCKVATYDPMRPRADRLICIYTYDFTDHADVRRVLNELVELNLVSTQGRGIYYKCDAYTYLDLGSQNEYKIKASLYWSKDVLQGDLKALPDGPIVRLLKRNGAIDTFMSG